MAGKPKLHYFDARGRMEAIRWLLAAAGVEFEEKLIESSEDLDKLRHDGSLVFQQVPMVEIDGMKLVQTRAILNYIATKYNLYGRDMKERALIDMYTEGVADLSEMIMLLPLCPPDQKNAKLTLIRERTTNRYLPAFEKVLKSHGQDYLVGNKLSKADIHLVELLYYVEELDPSLLANFPLLKFEEKFIEKPEDLDKLKNDGSLMFQQVPMVEIDGMKLVQTRAILNYIATKYNLYGKDMKERALIDMYSEGVADLGEMIMHLPLCPPAEKDAKLTLIREKTTNRYLPAFENVLKSHGQDYLVGNKLSRADIHLVELLYYVEELDPSLLANFPLLKASSTPVAKLSSVLSGETWTHLFASPRAQ
ncbi:hypothetical protein MJG53_017362 [Ovis ammon polii x Ovis aries]|uniref:Uncharacterized protein n=1 Tax=Ovis ammon polii x Ovis aries TaxID=2918886 RepID=A0ACB9U801_9CETA|nr:hypothetical protein MJG53_017362 [Ovis ammon polii x Ovis aries]